MRIATKLQHKVKVLEKEVWIPMKRGDRLAARIWLPEGADRIAGAGAAGIHPLPQARHDPARRRAQARLVRRPRLRQHPGRHGGRRRQLRRHARRVRQAGAAGRQGGHRLDRQAALVHRQGRHVRHLLGRLQRAPGRGPAAAGAEGDRHLLLDRRPLCRRHALHGRRRCSTTSSTGAPPSSRSCRCPATRSAWARTGAKNWMARLDGIPCPVELWMNHQHARRLLEARLGLRELRRHPVRRVRRGRLARRLHQRDPAPVVEPQGARVSA